MKIQKKNKSIALVHIGNREKSGLQIFEKLQQNNFKIKEWDVVDGKETLIGIDAVSTIVVNIGTTTFDYDDLLARLFDKDIKIIINEAELSNNLTGNKRKSWERHLLNKVDENFSLMPKQLDSDLNENKDVDFTSFGFKSVWVLAASIGGPEAITEFLSEFDGTEKIFFIIIQHIDTAFLPMVAQQFNQSSKHKIDLVVSGMQIKKINGIVFPTDENVKINHAGIIELEPLTTKHAFTPCIDESCKQLLSNIKTINMAIFSGMSTDGIDAAQLIKNAGNKVITQTESSCVLSTIVTGVKNKITVDFDGTPKQMAQYIIEESQNGK